MATFEEIRAMAKLPETSIALCLRGDLQAAFEDLDRQLKAARDRAKRGATLAGGSAEAKDIEEMLDALREQMRDSTVNFKLRAMTKKRFSDLKASKPPRDEDKAAGLDYNGETFTITLVQASLVDPALTIPEVEQLCDEVLTQGQWDTLFWQAMVLNRGTVDIPS